VISVVVVIIGFLFTDNISAKLFYSSDANLPGVLWKDHGINQDLSKFPVFQPLFMGLLKVLFSFACQSRILLLFLRQFTATDLFNKSWNFDKTCFFHYIQYSPSCHSLSGKNPQYVPALIERNEEGELKNTNNGRRPNLGPEADSMFSLDSRYL
jgi:hypothetical protein